MPQRVRHMLQTTVSNVAQDIRVLTRNYEALQASLLEPRWSTGSVVAYQHIADHVAGILDRNQSGTSRSESEATITLILIVCA